MAGAFAAILLFSGMLVNQIFMRGVTTVTVLETGDGAALLLERDGHNGLVAAGEEDRTMRAVQYALRERGIRRLDFVFFPDADDRCMNGVGLLEPDRVDVVAAPEKGAYLYQLEAFIPADKRLEWPAESRVEFWNDCILERGPGGMAAAVHRGHPAAAGSLPAVTLPLWRKPGERRRGVVVFRETAGIHRGNPSGKRDLELQPGHARPGGGGAALAAVSDPNHG